MQKINNSVRRNGGGASAVVLIFTVTLGLMAMAGAVLIQREGNSIGRTYLTMQGEYAAQGTLKYAIERYKTGDFDEYETIENFGGMTVYMDTMKLYSDTSGATVKIRILATDGDVEYIIDGKLQTGNVDKAGVVNGAVTDVWVYTEGGTKDASYLPSGVEVPGMDEGTLISMAATQLHRFDSVSPPVDWTATSGFYASNDFWFATGVPNVTYVQGNLTVPTGVTVYGLFLVGGNVTIAGSGRIEGVVLQPDATSQISMTSTSAEIRGGVISEGSVDGTKVTFLGFELAASKIRERVDRILEANNYLNNEPRLVEIALNPD